MPADTSWITPQITRFYDRSQWLTYILALEMARRIVERPELIARGRESIGRNAEHVAAGGWGNSPFYDRLWLEALELPPEEIARRMIADTTEGDRLRASMPVFEVIDTETRNRIKAENPWHGHSAA